jgi:hypothetical protein
VNVEIRPAPSPEERRAILDALAAVKAEPAAVRSRWRASVLAESGDGSLAEERGGDTGVVEP